MNERRILSSLSHPFLINMNLSFQDQNNLYLVMDYLRGGDLRYHICYKTSFSEKEISKLKNIKSSLSPVLLSDFNMFIR